MTNNKSTITILTTAEINRDEIIRYYDECQIDYELVWHLKNYMSMHYGYWDETTPNLRAALKNINIKLAEFANIRSGQKVLDVGCGVGGSSIFLAKNYKCVTTGITLSYKQVEICKKNALLHRMDNLCTFQQGNYLEMDFPDNTFDVVWGIESVCYAYNKIDFLNEAFRVLKPGGTVVVADFFHNDVAKDSAEWQLMDKWTSTWAINEYAGISGFRNDLTLAGFIKRSDKDVTNRVLKSIKRLYYSFFPGVIATYLGELFRIRTKTQTKNTWSTYYQYKAYKRGLWRYMFYSGIKPK